MNNNSSTVRASFTPGLFQGAHDFIINNSTIVSNSGEEKLIDDLAKSTLAGAEFDSAERDPPPSCHSGTRLDISQDLRLWIHDLFRGASVLWLNGPAGVGKSAIMQTISEMESESPDSFLGATIFLSKIRRRNDPQRIFVTIAYQLAIKYPSYRKYVVQMLARDPRVVHKSMREQFKRFIVQAVDGRELFEGRRDTVLILIDGLDECEEEWAQREIVSLVGQMFSQHPTSPFVWIIASRPEPSIMGAFAKLATYRDIKVPINSDQACRDVERYLREKLGEIQGDYSSSFPSGRQWPSELHFSTLAMYAQGHFGFASTAVQFIGDPKYANPVSQLQKVLVALKTQNPLKENPFGSLDALYSEILSAVPVEYFQTIWCLLSDKYLPLFFLQQCNFWGITQQDAYGAFHKLHSVLKVPQPEEAVEESVWVYHLSFIEYLTTPSRSGAFYMDEKEIRKWALNSIVRILEYSYIEGTPRLDINRIRLSWNQGHLIDTEVRKDIFREAFQFLFTAPPDLDDCLERLSGFFRTVDLGVLIRTHLSRTSGDIFFHLLQEPFCSKFRSWGVLDTIPAKSLNSANVRPCAECCLGPVTSSVWEEGKSIPISLTARLSYLGLESLNHWFQLVRQRHSFGSLSMGGDFWKTISKQDSAPIDQLSREEPSYPVFVIGKGSNAYALIWILLDRGTPSLAPCLYTIPYDRS